MGQKPNKPRHTHISLALCNASVSGQLYSYRVIPGVLGLAMPQQQQ